MFQADSGNPVASPGGPRGVCVCDERGTGTEHSEYCRQRHARNATHSCTSEDTANTANRNSAILAVRKYPSLGATLQLTATTSTSDDVRSCTLCYRVNC
jgi:hypothetical protein